MLAETSALPYLFPFLLDLPWPPFVLQAALFSPSLPPSSSSLFLCPSPCFPICRSSTVFLLPLLHDYRLLLFASLSVSISFTPEPPGVAYALLILSDFTRQTLYKRWVLLRTWSCAAHIAKKKIILLLTSKPSLRRDTLGLGTPGTLWGWALQTQWGWALQGDSPGTLGLGAPGLGWALQKHFAGWALPGAEKTSGRGEELRLRSNSPTPRVGNKRKEHKDKGR